jgi:hypothetical protein
MDTVGTILSWVGSLIILVCHIIVIVKMFQHGQTALGIIAIIGTCCLFGLLLTLIYGWMRATQWNIKNVMLAYTVGWVLDIAGTAMNPAQFTDIQTRIQQQQPAR